MLNNEDEYRKMAETEEQLWWYRILHRKVHKAIAAAFHSDKTIRILDAGCGTGGLMFFLKNHGYQYLQGLDISSHALQYSRKKGLEVQEGSVAELSKHFIGQTFDVIVSCDVLYFFPEKEILSILEDWRTLLKPGGIIVLNLPALEVFRGMHDISVGIPKRFTYRQLEQLLSGTGLNISTASYWPFLLSPLIYFARLWQRIKLKNSNTTIHSDVNLPPAFINRTFYTLTKLESVLPGRKFGSSLFAVLQQRELP